MASSGVDWSTAAVADPPEVGAVPDVVSADVPVEPSEELPDAVVDDDAVSGLLEQALVAPMRETERASASAPVTSLFMGGSLSRVEDAGGEVGGG
jgi:hypothetical protein